MNKNQLLKEIRIRARITNVESAAFYQAFVEVVGEELAQNDELRILHFGKFTCKKVAARSAKLFGSKTATKIPARRQIRFKAFSALSAKI